MCFDSFYYAPCGSTYPEAIGIQTTEKSNDQSLTAGCPRHRRSRGIGAASARALADEGANVAISYVASADKAEAVVNELKAEGVQARAFKRPGFVNRRRSVGEDVSSPARRVVRDRHVLNVDGGFGA